VSRRTASFLLACGLFQWLVWPTFLKNIWSDPRSFDDGPTGFLVVHAVLTAVQLVLATVLLVLGARDLRRRSSA
jgi:intracellular septation protein A